MVSYLLTFAAGAFAVLLLWVFYPEDKEVAYLRGVLSAIRDAEHCTSEDAFEYYEDTSWKCSAYGQSDFDRGYRRTLTDLRVQWVETGRDLL